MLHIATVHFGTPSWIEIQARELRRHLEVPYRTWTSLEEIDPSYEEHFDRVVQQRGSHAQKLNHLAIEIAHEAAGDDLLVFLDGDAFPVADPLPLIERGLADAPLLAIRRSENYNDPQPHPSFCVTRVSTWRDLPGDWSQGFCWTGPGGNVVTDVGANLLRQLELRDMPWTPVRRTNRHDLHPVFFGVYGDAIYHHGAGFRRPFCRADLVPWVPAGTFVAPQVGGRIARNEQISKALYERIRGDDRSWLAELI